jgi:dTDP-4-dehydrorhamnose 3,5-epimerase
MGKVSLKDIAFSSLKTINIDGGNVRHILKSNDKEFKGFGEAYFSDINPGSIKAWKCHNKMHMNLVVPFGHVKFVFHEENTSRFLEKEVDEKNYSLISVPPGIWFGFMGMGKSKSIILNIADIIHDPEEVTRLDQSDIKYNWS